jgi:hypothetical protein
MRRGVLVLLLVAVAPGRARAEWQVKPFVGVASGGGGDTTFLLADPAGSKTVVFGASTVLLGEVLGVEGDVGHAPGFFTPFVQDTIVGSSVTTLTGNVVLAMPRRLTNYTLRLYFVGGAGMMRVNMSSPMDTVVISDTLPAMDLGGGVTGFLTNRVGLNWDVRHFRSLTDIDARDSIGPPAAFSFWRVSMALAIRY